MMRSRTLLSRLSIFLVIFTQLLVTCQSQTVFNCPDTWEKFGAYCYKFEGDSPLKFESATRACSEYGASLLAVESVEENTFIRNRLETTDQFHRTWLTSGHGGLANKDPEGVETGFVWGATSLPVLQTLQFWLPGQPDPGEDTVTSVIAYVFSGSAYGWSLVSEGDPFAYICKIPDSEAYRIVQVGRDYDYGQNVADRGPHFLQMPYSIVVIQQTDQVAVLDCVAYARPEPTYKWFRGEGFTEEVSADLNNRYTLTNGRLEIHNPTEIPDADDYRCQVTNKYGTIISSSVSISFGFLAEFNNVQNAPVRAMAYDGVAIECSPINYKPAVRYQWLKDAMQFIRPSMQTYIFISFNGKLYFSEVTEADEGEYKCIATLAGINQYAIGTTQPPARISMGIPLLIQGQAPKSHWGPEIQDDFPAVFPKPPLSGQDVRIECFAYGSSNTLFYYSWQREDNPMPTTARTEDNNRVLIIGNAQLEDAGNYTCTVVRTSSARDSRTIYLSIAARPYFVAPLRDQHADVGSQLTWRCDARGMPTPVYSWYKNGQPLQTNSSMRFEVKGNILIITDLQADLHDGMYQCGAVNSHGVEMSNAQLRVLAFAPNLEKNPLPQQITGAVDGNITIVCNPEGAPLPVITWSKDGRQLASDNQHIMQLTNGNLIIIKLTQADVGRYTCKAENRLGIANSTTLLALSTGATISLAPSPTTVIVNSTAFIPCQASRQPSVDLTFVWHFNGHLIDTNKPEYTKMDTHPLGQTGLYVRNVQFRNEGMYRCSISTPFTQAYREAYLTVRGPPGMVGGVQVEKHTVTRYEATVLWANGAENGGTIVSYIIEAEDEFNLGIWSVVKTLRAQDAIQASVQANVNMRRTMVEELNPGTGYYFRVIALNEFGPGIPSEPSTYIKTLDAPPNVAPENVRGGGGSVGELTIKWDLLNRAQWGSTSVWYRIYWRPHAEGIEEGMWRKQEKWGEVDTLVELVGEENFYLVYDVMVQAINIMGAGPNSSIVEVFSAEGMPLGTATNVKSDTYNCTAIEVSWVPVSDIREVVKGRIKGYQINYWPEFSMASDHPQFIRYYGQVDTGLVIGLESDVNTWVDVQVFNSAGLGPRSEAYIMETAHVSPTQYPEDVRVYSEGAGKAHVWWRGIGTVTEDAGLFGYVLFYWNANENFRSALIAEVLLPANEYTLTDLEKGTLYALRIAGYNAGGYGKRSPTHYFTFEGTVFLDYAFSQNVDVFLAQAAIPVPSVLLLSLLLLLRFC